MLVFFGGDGQAALNRAAEKAMDALEALRSRRSVRAYRPEPVDRAVLEELVDCARLAPSARNLQPIDFVVVTSPEGRQDLADQCEYGSYLAEAAACIAITAKPVEHHLEDAACAATCLLVAARAKGLGGCWVHVHGKPEEKTLAADLALPAGHRIVCILAVGHGEQPPTPPKRDLADVLHWERHRGQ